MRFPLCLAVCCLLGHLAGAADFTIAEPLGRTWQNELVRFAATPAQLAAARDRHGLADRDGRYVKYQTLPDNMIGVAVDLEPWETQTYTFSDEVLATVTSLNASEEPGTIRLFNERVGVAIRTTLGPGEGPLAAIYLGSDAATGWIGGSRLTVDDQLRATYRARLDYTGDLLAQVTCTLGDPAQPTWSWTFRLQAGEPVVTVEEDFRAAEAANWELELGKRWQPAKLLYRYGMGANGKAVGIVDMAELTTIEGTTKFVLEPWIHWWERIQQGNWFALYGADDGPMLMIGAYGASVWVDPAQPAEDRKLARVPLVAGEDGALALRFAGRHAQRHWLIGSFAAAEVLPGVDDYDVRTGPTTPIPQRALIKHGHFPLDALYRQVHAWPHQLRQHPRLYLSESTLADFRQRYVPDEAAIAQLLRTEITPFLYDDAFYHYLGSGNEELELKLIETAKARVAYATRMIYEQDGLVYYGFAPHHQSSIIASVTISDLVWSSLLLANEERARLASQLAFLGYAVADEDYWSPPRGYSANPNMTTTVASFQTALGAFLRDHPQADAWLGMGLKELERQVIDWSDEKGGWLECPHYAMVSYDYYLGYFLMAHLAGYSDFLYSDRMKNVITWFAQIATPPDPRLNNWRHNPSLGNTWVIEPCGNYATIAVLWREKDPVFASHLAWMQLQQGDQAQPGVGGFFPTLAGYRRIYRTIPVTPSPPAWGSELFPETTAVFRSHFPSDRETMLTLIVGRHHAHYDFDSGALTFWGKGSLIVDDFGYEGRQPGWQHAMLISPIANHGGEMQVGTFFSQPALDYLSGTKHQWRRQLALAKDRDPLGPNFLVIRDSLSRPDQGEWRLWFTAEKVTNTADGALVTGAQDVDTQVVLPLLPSGAALTNQQYASNTWGLGTDGKYGKHEWPQTSLTVTWERGDDLLAVVYPRLRDEQPATITALPGNAGVKVVSPHGTDYVFLTREAVTVEIDGIAFAGTVGSVQLRPGQPPVLTLAASGRLSLGNQTIEREK